MTSATEKHMYPSKIYSFYSYLVTVIVTCYRANLVQGQSQNFKTYSKRPVCVRIASLHNENMARYRCALLLSVVAAVLADDLVVLKQGRLKGHRLTTRKGREIFAFQRIPYAIPPVGKLRFQVRSTGRLWASECKQTGVTRLITLDGAKLDHGD